MSRARYIALVALSASTLVGAAAEAKPVNELSVSAGLDSAFDDNVYNSRGADFVNRITPHGSYRLIDQRVNIDTSYDFSYWTYALGKANNSLNHRADVSVEGHPTRRLTLKVADEFSRAEDPGFLSRMGVVAPQIGIFDNVADASAGVNIVRRVYAGVGYTYHWARFDEYNAMQAATYPTLYDGAEHDVQGTTNVAITRRDDLRFAGRFQMFTAGPQATDANRWNVGATYSPTLGWRHQLLRELEITADAGPLFYDRLSGSQNLATFGGNPPSSGWTWRGGAQIRYNTPAWRAAAGYVHDLLGATGAGTALWADAVYAQAGYHYLEKFDAHIGVGYFRNGAAVDQPWAYDGVTVDSLVDYRVVDYFRVGAYYTLRWQEAGPALVGAGQFPTVTRNIVGIRLLAVLGADARPPRREVHP
ncbi:MAG: hypothetical protein JWN44_7011 [Myxococcales bacterium]|nr:hypothetical protein [Myxococcales bacterium]